MDKPARGSPPPSLTFRAHRGLTPRLLGKTFFSTRRPALETGGQRPTARCALGREIVWTIVLAFCAKPHRSSSPAKAGDPVSQSYSGKPRSRGVLDTPLSRGMTVMNDGRTEDNGIVRQSVGKAWWDTR